MNALQRSIRERLPAAALARAHERVAHLGRAIAVLEGRAVGRHVRFVGDRAEEVVQLCTNVSPQPMMWPGGHQLSQNGWTASDTRTVVKPRVLSSPALNTWSSLRRSMSNASAPLLPLISHWNALRRPSANRVASSVPTAPFSNSTV